MNFIQLSITELILILKELEWITASVIPMCNQTENREGRFADSLQTLAHATINHTNTCACHL